MNIFDTIFKTIFYAIFHKLHWYLTLAINLKGGDLINYSKLFQELEVGLSFYALSVPQPAINPPSHKPTPLLLLESR